MLLVGVTLVSTRIHFSFLFLFLFYDKTSSQYSVLPGVNEQKKKKIYIYIHVLKKEEKKEKKKSNRYNMMANKRVKGGEVFTMIMVKTYVNTFTFTFIV